MINNTKKLIKSLAVLLLCISVLLSGNVFSAGATTDSLAADELELLQVLEIVGQEHDLDFFAADQQVTRGEFAKYAAKLLNIDTTGKSTLFYHDVPRVHYAYDAITALTEAGYFSGTGSKTFEPDSFIRQEHAYIFMLKALGCGAYLESSFNSRTITELSRTTGLSAKIAARENLTLAGMFRLLYNALFADVYDVSGVGAEKVTVSLSGENLLYRTRRLVYVKNALVSASAGINIYGEVRDDRVTVVGDKEFRKSQVGCEKHLGHYVDYMYRDYRDDQYDELVWINNRFDDDSLVIEKDKKASYNKASRVLTYFEDGSTRAKKVILPQNMLVVYNGAYTGDDIDALLEKERYTITLFDINGVENGLAIIEAYENMYVSAVATAEFTVYDERTNKKLSLDKDDYESLIICDFAGNNMEFSSLKPGNVLSIFKSVDEKVLKAVCSNETVEGNIENIKTKGTTNIITVLGQEYEFFSSSYNTTNLRAGTSVELFLDFKGFIEELKTGGNMTGYSVGYLAQGVVDSLFESTMRVRILTNEGDVKVYNLANNVSINNQRQQDGNTAFTTLSSGSPVNGIKPQLVLYRLNANNEIAKIYTACEEGQPFTGLLQTGIIPDETNYTPYPEINITSFQSYYHSRYNNNTKLIGNKVQADGDTVVFFVPKDDEIISATDDSFTVGKLQHNQDYQSSTVYRLSDEVKGAVDFVVAKQAMAVEAITSKNMPVVFDSFIDVWDAEREEVGKNIQYVTNAGAFGEIKVSSKPADNLDIASFNLKRGDVFRYSTNRDGEIANIKVIYRADGSEMVIANTEVLMYESRFVGGYIHDVYDGIIMLGYTSGADYGELVVAPASVLIYDSQKDEFFMGSVFDAKTWKRDVNSCSRMAVQQADGLSKLMIIYK